MSTTPDELRAARERLRALWGGGTMDAAYGTNLSVEGQRVHCSFDMELLARAYLAASWQPIGTAPKRETVVVLIGGRARVAYQTDHGGGLMDTWRDSWDGTQVGWPTHWAPLPPGPLTESPA